MIKVEIAQDERTDTKNTYHVNIDTGDRGRIQGVFEQSEIRQIIEDLDNAVHH